MDEAQPNHTLNHICASLAHFRSFPRSSVGTDVGRSSVPVERASDGQKPLRDPGAGQAPFSDLHRGRVAARLHPSGFGADPPGQLVPSAGERRVTAFRLRDSGKSPAFRGQAPRLDKCQSSFKSFTAGRLIELLEALKAKRLLDRLRLAKQAHKRDREYQFWQEGSHAELICSEPVMRQKLDSFHQNPVQRGYVDLPEHWRYSSARNYLGQSGLIEIDPWF